MRGTALAQGRIKCFDPMLFQKSNLFMIADQYAEGLITLAIGLQIIRF